MNEENEQAEPETAKLLDEAVDFIQAHVFIDDIQARLLAAYAMMTHGQPAMCPTCGRLLITTRLAGLEGKGHGKTTAMTVTASLCANPEDARGTYASLRAKLASAANQPDNPARTFYHDRIEQVYGTSGTAKGNNATLTLLLEGGYKEGAKDSWSRNGSDQPISLFFPCIVTANGTGLPSDLRQRAIVVNMSQGKPRRYFSVRESQAEADELAQALGAAVAAHMDELKAFRARGIHEKLDERLLEVWEGVFAVAYVLGGQRWLNWMLEAFTMLALNSELSALSPRQQILRDCAGLLDKVTINLPSGRRFTEGMSLADELIRQDNEIYKSKTPRGMAAEIAKAMPVPPKQIRIGERRINGYFADDVIRAWDEIRPPEMQDAEIPEEENPFAVSAVSDADFDEVFEIPTQPRGVSASARSAANGRRK